MAAPETKEWRARENVHQPEGVHLLVGGQVEVRNLNKAPKLAKTDSRDPKVLGLALTIVDTDEEGGDVVCWKAANYHEEVTPDQYTGVVIRWEGDVIQRVPVIDDREHSALLDKQSTAQNTVAAKAITLKPEKPAAKKAAPKKAAAKKAAPKKQAPKAVGGAKKAKKKAAKKTAKKAAKKGAKKTAKKAAKKSTLKKLVKKLVRKLSPAKKKRR
jgi:hypothetical protein